MRNNSDGCNNSDATNVEFHRIGPASLYRLFGFTIPLIYPFILGFVIGLWIYAFYFRPFTTDPFFIYVLCLQLSPISHVTLTLPALLSPPTAPLVSLLQDIVSVFSMLLFTLFTTRILGGLDHMAKLATTCPIATPPLCCLLPCTRPAVTKQIVRLILFPVKLLSVVILVNFLINMYLVYSGFYPNPVITEISNLHNILLIPFFISCMYTYKVFIAVTNSMLLGTKHTLRGTLIFIMFVFCKITLTIRNILTGKLR
jgi:hypothetical protein